MSGTMKYSRDGLKLTESFEGCVLTSYRDIGGVWTIGYGHTKEVRSGMHCDQAMAEAWLLMDVKNAEQAVNLFVVVPLSQDEFDALVDFVFNLGAGNFLRSTLLILLNTEDYLGAADQFERWDRANGKEVAGLLRRRIAEENLFKGGIV
jgi:lysozyme